jgi:hypothetical protein
MRKAIRSFGARWSGAAAVSGGTLLTAFALLAAAKPAGCIGTEQCAIRPQREYGDLPVLLILAVLLIAAACVGLSLQARRVGVSGAWWRTGATLVALGVALLFLGMASNLVSGDLPPLFVTPGFICLAVGGLLVGILVVRSAILPRYASPLLIVGALALPWWNDQNWQVLFMVPFGVAWVVAGYALLRQQRSGVQQRDAG